MAKPQESTEEKDPRIKQVVVGVLVLLALTTVIVVTLACWRYLPEVLGDWVGTMVGFMSTPFFLEASFIFIGLTIVVAINHWRRKRAGDDFVELEVKETEE